MALSLQNGINSRNGPGGNKNRSVWLRVGTVGIAIQAVSRPCGAKGILPAAPAVGCITKTTIQIIDAGYGMSFRVKTCGQKRGLM